MIVRVLPTCHTQYTSDSSICIFLFNRTTLQVFVTYLTVALYVHPLWFYKHQHDNRVHSKLFVACQRWLFQWRFWFVPSVPGYLREEEEHKPEPWRNPIERNHNGLHLENEVALVKTPTIISNNHAFSRTRSVDLCVCVCVCEVWCHSELYVIILAHFSNLTFCIPNQIVSVLVLLHNVLWSLCRNGIENFSEIFWHNFISFKGPLSLDHKLVFI